MKVLDVLNQLSKAVFDKFEEKALKEQETLLKKDHEIYKKIPTHENSEW